ncbi:T9SS C-terminal target domain-containing protein [candidate division KSB1 bacterium]|nr:MAG: T9SS C-terminal target domain-containing protein [candidate division KSB1 bacterium]
MRSSLKAQHIIILLLLTAQIGVTQPYEGPDTLWMRIHPQPDIESLHAKNAVSLEDGGIMLSGYYTTLNETDHGPYMARLDSNGNLLWRRPCHDSVFVTNYPTHMCKVRSDRFALAATVVYSGLWNVVVTLCDGEANVIWQRPFYSQMEHHYVEGICRSSDGGILVNFSLTDYTTDTQTGAVIKLDIQGNLVWRNHYSIEGCESLFRGIDATPDGGCVLAGGAWGDTAIYSPLLAKVDSAGNLEFFRSYRISDDCRIYGIIRLATGDYILCGSIGVIATEPLQALVMGVNSAGDSLWSWFSDSSWGSWEAAKAVETNDGGFLIWSVMYLRFDADGTLLWRRSYPLPAPYHYYGNMDIMIDEQNRIVIAGAAQSEITADNFIIAMKTQPDLSAATDLPSIILPTNIALRAYPNPFNSTTQIVFTLPITQRVSLRVYNVLGREVAELMNEMRTAGEHRVRFDGSGLSSGVYFCRMEAGTEMRTQKIVLLK